jgi:hypothetical protein
MIHIIAASARAMTTTTAIVRRIVDRTRSSRMAWNSWQS